MQVGNLWGKDSEQHKYHNVLTVAPVSPPPACIGNSFWNYLLNLSVETMKTLSNTLREGLHKKFNYGLRSSHLPFLDNEPL